MTLEDDHGIINGIINNRRRWGGAGECSERGEQDYAGEKAFHPGAAGERETRVCGTESLGQTRPAEEAPGTG